MGLEILYLLIPVTLLLALVALGWFVWAIHNGQFDDLETPAIRVLFDDAAPAAATPPPPRAGDPDTPRPPAAQATAPTQKRTE
jgi:cbb3-type cytochrome oxidase maturation protein